MEKQQPWPPRVNHNPAIEGGVADIFKILPPIPEVSREAERNKQANDRQRQPNGGRK